VHRDPGPHEIGKMGELGAHQILDINSLALVPDQQVLIGCKCLDALSEALDKIFRVTSGGLAGDCRLRPSTGRLAIAERLHSG
jgi:hypothetical protein